MERSIILKVQEKVIAPTCLARVTICDKPDSIRPSARPQSEQPLADCVGLRTATVGKNRAYRTHHHTKHLACCNSWRVATRKPISKRGPPPITEDDHGGGVWSRTTGV